MPLVQRRLAALLAAVEPPTALEAAHPEVGGHLGGAERVHAQGEDLVVAQQRAHRTARLLGLLTEVHHQVHDGHAVRTAIEQVAEEPHASGAPAPDRVLVDQAGSAQRVDQLSAVAVYVAYHVGGRRGRPLPRLIHTMTIGASTNRTARGRTSTTRWVDSP